MSNIKAIAFYLPQFHPIPENDEWWGKGFTEWTNVTRARPLFRGHYQPHLPADLGFYDLRLPETRQAQADLALEYGIQGFCYYHYWFNGKRLLQRPFDDVLASGSPDFPFCLCWANENWTRTWDGQGSRILMAQNYHEEDDRQHMRWLVNAFRDERYIRYRDKPVFLVYSASKLPDPLKTTSVWREEAKKLGAGDIYLLRVECSPNEQTDPASLGFDAAVEFQPDWGNLGDPLRRKGVWRYSHKLGMSESAFRHSRVYDYATTVQRMLSKPDPAYKRFPCVTPAWDNSARRKVGAYIFKDSTPEAYEKWLASVVGKLKASGAQDDFVFINAWNEWAEGNHLEPCQRWGRAYLEATKRALNS
jgi:lipopolysaccharide biosynthesis protein